MWGVGPVARGSPCDNVQQPRSEEPGWARDQQVLSGGDQIANGVIGDHEVSVTS